MTLGPLALLHATRLLLLLASRSLLARFSLAGDRRHRDSQRRRRRAAEGRRRRHPGRRAKRLLPRHVPRSGEREPDTHRLARQVRVHPPTRRAKKEHPEVHWRSDPRAARHHSLREALLRRLGVRRRRLRSGARSPRQRRAARESRVDERLRCEGSGNRRWGARGLAVRITIWIAVRFTLGLALRYTIGGAVAEWSARR